MDMRSHKNSTICHCRIFPFHTTNRDNKKKSKNMKCCIYLHIVIHKMLLLFKTLKSTDGYRERRNIYIIKYRQMTFNVTNIAAAHVILHTERHIWNFKYQCYNTDCATHKAIIVKVV
ncbi:hypothetical protein QE152_g37016 [Popillia japonica]|uniref:Uncharacterized protein n=1 Tax=Popillia japonica TaxID=7064 RepID=A0AAW1IBH0_POPJA